MSSPLIAGASFQTVMSYKQLCNSGTYLKGDILKFIPGEG